MADQWNDGIPALTNTIANDIPDIEENFGWMQQVLKMCIGWKTDTIATVSPPGPQRSKFVSTSDTVVTVEPGVYFHDGTTRQMVFWDADLAFTVGSGGTNALSEDLGADEWHYLYIDDSAVITLGSNELDNTCLVNNTTAPTWSDAKHGYYSGSDLCIFAFYSDGDSDIEVFYHDGGDSVFFGDTQSALVNTDIDLTWTDVTLVMPGFSTKAQCQFSSIYVDGASALRWRTNGFTGTIGHRVCEVDSTSTEACANAIVMTDSSQIIEVMHTITNGNTSSLRTEAWFFPTGM